MAKDATQVLTGPGTLYMAPEGEAFPADPSATPAGNWDDMGYTDDGAAFEVEMSFQDVEVAEEPNPIDTRLESATYGVTTALAQLTLENIQTVLNGGTITTIAGPPQRRTYTPPSTGEETAFALLYRFLNEYAFNTDIEAPKVRSVVNASVPFRTAPQKSLLNTTFRFAQPSAGEVFTIDEYVSA